jgi:hypothetical protein
VVFHAHHAHILILSNPIHVITEYVTRDSWLSIRDSRVNSSMFWCVSLRNSITLHCLIEAVLSLPHPRHFRALLKCCPHVHRNADSRVKRCTESPVPRTTSWSPMCDRVFCMSNAWSRFMLLIPAPAAGESAQLTATSQSGLSAYESDDVSVPNTCARSSGVNG